MVALMTDIFSHKWKIESKLYNLDFGIKNNPPRTSLAVQWLRLRASNAGSMGSIPGRGTKIPHGVGRSKKKIHQNDNPRILSVNSFFFLRSFQLILFFFFFFFLSIQFPILSQVVCFVLFQGNFYILLQT